MGGPGSGAKRRKDLPRQCSCGAFIDRNCGGAGALCATCYQAERRRRGGDRFQATRNARSAVRVAERVERRRQREIKRLENPRLTRGVSVGAVQLFTDLPGYNPRGGISWTETAEALPGMSIRPCRECGSPPSFGRCAMCHAEEPSVSLPDVIHAALPTYHVTGRMDSVDRRAQHGRVVIGELVEGSNGFWRER